MRIRAAVAESRGAPFTIEELELSDPRPDEVLVRIVATGICQTDLHVRDQEYPVPLPIVAGHEGTGVVEQVGAAVDGIEPGQRVVLSYPYCGHCRYCRVARYPYCEHGFALSFGGSRLDGSSALRRAPGAGDGNAGDLVNGHIFQQSSFATHVVTSPQNVVPVPDDPELPLELLGPLACGMQTGAGAALHTLGVRPGSSFAVFGTGGVGLAAVMAAKAAGAGPIIAVDVNPTRLELAARLGATHTVNGREEDVEATIERITRVGADHILEVTARPEMLALALRAVAMTGTAALVGGAPAGTTAAIDMNTLLNGRTLRGVVQGDAVPQLFIPTLIEMYREGRFPFDQLVQFYPFEQINDAIADMQQGRTVKPILRIGSTS